ncbi:MAG TPA: hypothetical protein VFG05_06495 [Methylocella sp.]|nr:hypothetical protein [Methylocella sp.]
MRPISERVTLGEKSWVIRPLTLGQVREIEPALMESGGNIGSAMRIIEIALRRDHAEDAARLAELEATAPEIAAAMSVILRLGGFIETTPGESQAAGTGMHSGVSSTAA